MRIGVIGAGLGGLSAAAILAAKGHEVVVFEKNSTPGGKMNIVEAEGFRFDTGPSLLTMPFVLEKIFRQCGEQLTQYLQIEKLAPLCRYFFNDGVTFDCFTDLTEMLKEIDHFAPKDREAYVRFLGHCARLYEKTAPAFLFNSLNAFQDLNKLTITDFLKINPFKTVSESVDQWFSSPHLRQFFKRFTTYNGSSPFQAPATLNVIPYVELCLGGYYVKGGMYNIARSLFELGKKKGAKFQFATSIHTIHTQNSRCTALVDEKNKQHTFDCIVSNSDAAHTYLNLIGQDQVPAKVKKKHQQLEPSCSGFVLLLGIDASYRQLNHHNVFFASDYEAEFKAIFQENKLYEDPTIYVANTSVRDPADAIKGGSNLFILVNAPYLSAHQNWKNDTTYWRNIIINKLKHRGLKNLDGHIMYQKIITPADFAQQYLSNRGSIYGTSSNSRWAAFKRPKNKSPHFENLYLVGGSTHPGGGIPLVLLSALNACNLIMDNS